MMMAEAAPIADQLVRIMDVKGIDVSVWAPAFVMALLSVELNGVRVDDNFIIGIVKTIYKVQQEAEKIDDLDKANAS